MKQLAGLCAKKVLAAIMAVPNLSFGKCLYLLLVVFLLLFLLKKFL